MGDLFPVGAGMGRIRAILEITKEFGGSIELSRLAEESRNNLDALLPLIEATNQLGFTKISGSSIKLTPEGKKVNLKNETKIIRQKLADIEPFKSAKKIIGTGEVNSEALFDELARMGYVLHGDKETNSLLLKKLFIRWGVRSKLLKYNAETDIWSLTKN